jgi:hypothetical protein
MESMQALLQYASDLWWREEGATTDWGPLFSAKEQESREARLTRFLELIGNELKRAPQSDAERQALQERALAGFACMSREALDFTPAQVDILLARGFSQSAAEFAQMARRFDPAVSGSDIYQASRNLWTENGLQVLLGLPVALTPAMFAYSMLYPYTDNYLDDPRVSLADKAVFSERLAQRLRGQDSAPASERELKIFALIDMIEEQYLRAAFSQVHDSLLAIHAAQGKSLRLLRRKSAPYEVDALGISLEKGGASVLADGYLVAGTLTDEQARFMFGYGAFLQFVDDLQDVEMDARDGLSTIFSQIAGRWPLDALIERTYRFGCAVLDRRGDSFAPDAAPLIELMYKSAAWLLIPSSEQTRRWCSRDYLRALERHSPFRFAYMDRVRKRLAQQRLPLLRLIEAFACV